MKSLLGACRRNRRLSALALVSSLAATGGCLAEFGELGEDELAQGSQEITNAFADQDTPIRNSTVFVRGATGALIAPDVVVTNGHVANVPVTLTDGRWHPIVDAGGNPVVVTINIGPDRNNPRHVATARWYNMPPRGPNGQHADLIMLGLDNPVPSHHAVPREVIWDAARVGSSWVYGVGFGGTTARQWSVSNNFRLENDPTGNYYSLDFLAGNAQLGDSGSPVYLGGVEGPIVGINQQVTPGGQRWRGFATYTTGANGFPNMSSWFRANTERSFCAQTRSNSRWHNGVQYARLLNLWNHHRSDNLAQTSQFWHGCYPNFDRRDGYVFYRHEGWVRASWAAGTEALYLYWNPLTQNNATTTFATRPTQSGWQYVGLLGYVHTSAGTNRQPLRLWYSAGRNDYHTTTHWLSDPNYQYRGIIGYIDSPTSIP